MIIRDLFLKTERPGGEPGAIVTVPLQFFVTVRMEQGHCHWDSWAQTSVSRLHPQHRKGSEGVPDTQQRMASLTLLPSAEHIKRFSYIVLVHLREHIYSQIYEAFKYLGQGFE